jgi:hypothetical protein
VKALGEAHEGRVSERGELLAELVALAGERTRLEQTLGASRQERVGGQRALDALGLRLGSAGRELQRLETTATEQRVEHAGRAERRDRLATAYERARTGAEETGDWIRRREQEISGCAQLAATCARLGPVDSCSTCSRKPRLPGSLLLW